MSQLLATWILSSSATSPWLLLLAIAWSRGGWTHDVCGPLPELLTAVAAEPQRRPPAAAPVETDRPAADAANTRDESTAEATDESPGDADLDALFEPAERELPAAADDPGLTHPPLGDEAANEGNASGAENPSRRMPRHFARLQLDSQQRAKLAEFQQEYQVKLQRLRQQLSEQEALRDKAYESVLTPAQLKKLKQLRTPAPR